MAQPAVTTDQDFLGEHLPYELWMLRETYAKLSSPPSDGVLCNALIESFCIHARQLLDFFENEQGKRAKEFTGGSYSAAHLSGLTKSERNKLNTQIAHLTGKRTVTASQKIDDALRAKMLTALEREAERFERELAPQFQGMFVRPEPSLLIRTGGAPSATNAPTVATTSTG